MAKTYAQCDDRIKQYTITTEAAEEFIQDRINSVLKMEKKDPIEITMFNTPVGRSTPKRFFIPFIIRLEYSDSTVVNGKKNDNDDINDIDGPWKGRMNKQGKPVRLQDSIWKVLSIYKYNKDTKRIFDYDKFLQDYRISRERAQFIKSNTEPKKFDDHSIILFIDPIAVFYDIIRKEMAKDGDNRKFYIDIVDAVKINKGKGDYKFTVNRVISGNKNKHKKNDDNFFNQINNMMIQSGRR